MNNLSAHQILHLATAWVREDLDSDKRLSPTTAGCASCCRAWEDTEAPDQAYAYSYSSTQALEQLCITCYTLRIPAIKALGIEKFHQGNPDHPVGGKLGMLTDGASGVMTSDGDLYLSLPKGFLKKYKDGLYGKADRILAVSGLFQLMNALLLDGRLALSDIEKGVVLIEKWGRKPEVLLYDLSVTRHLSEVWCCTDKGAYSLNLLSILRIGVCLHRHSLLSEGARKPFWDALELLSNNEEMANDKAVQKWISMCRDKGLDIDLLIEKLPVDPHSRTVSWKLLDCFQPSIKQGVISC